MKTFDLIRTEVDVEALWNLGTNLQFEALCPLRNFLPRGCIEHFFRKRLSKLKRVKSVNFACEVEWIETNTADSVLLLFVEIHLQTQPTSAVHPDEFSASLDERFDFSFAQIHSLDFHDDLQVKPIDFLINDLESHLRLNRLSLERCQISICIDFDIFRKGFKPLCIFFGKVLCHPNPVTTRVRIVTWLHRCNERTNAVEQVSLVLVYRVSVAGRLLGDFPAFTAKHFLTRS